MTIKEIYIDAFGKFNNYSLSFEKGLNIIYGENEAGKSTIINFIVMVLYGSNSRSQDLLQNDRKKYRPWHSNNMGGHIIVEKNNKLIRIERIFEASNTTDKVKIIEETTGREIVINSNKQPGDYLLGLNYETFKKSILIQSESISFENGKDEELNKKLLNLVTSGEEDTSKLNAIKNIDTRVEKLISKRGDKGEIISLKNEIKDIYISIENSKNDEVEKESFNERKNKLEIEKKYNSNILSLLEKKHLLISEKREAQMSQKDLELSINKNGDLWQLENDKKNLIKQREKLGNMLLGNNFYITDIALVFAICFALIAVIFNPLIFIMSLISISIYIYGIIVKNNKKNIKLVNINEEIKNLEDQISEKNQIKNNKFEELKFVNSAIDELNFQIVQINTKLNKNQNLDIKDVRDRIFNIESEILKINSTVKERYRGKENLSTLINDLSIKNLELEKLERKYSLLNKTKEILLESYNDFEISFSKLLNDEASMIISQITNNKYNRLMIDDNFDISIVDQNTKRVKGWRYLSSGTIDQMYLALRLVIAKLLIEDKSDRIFILDDIFIRYDDDRILNTINILLNNKNEYEQMLLFTCHKNEVFRKRDINIINI